MSTTVNFSVCLADPDEATMARIMKAVGLASTMLFSYPNQAEARMLLGAEIALHIDGDGLTDTVKGKYYRTDIRLQVKPKGDETKQLILYHFQTPGGGISYLSKDQVGREMSDRSIFGDFFRVRSGVSVA